MIAVPVLWLDLDGTVRESVDDPLGRFVNGPEDVRVFPEAVTMMRRLTTADPVHWSPLEHPATPVPWEHTRGNFDGWHQVRHMPLEVAA